MTSVTSHSDCVYLLLSTYFGYLDSNIPPIARQLEILTLNIFGYLELFLALFSHVSSNDSMMSLSTRCVRTGGMIFSLLSAYGFNSKIFEIFMKRGVHYKSLYLVLDGQVYLDSFSLFKFNDVWDLSLSVEVNSSC